MESNQFTTSPQTFTSLSVAPTSTADADVRPGKKRCRDGQIGAATVLPQGVASTWHTGFNPDTHAASNCDGITTWPGAKSDPAGFQPGPLWPEPGVSNQWNVLPNTLRPAAEPQPLEDPWFTMASTRTAWGSLPSSPVGHMTPDSSCFSPLVDPHETYSQFPAVQVAFGAYPFPASGATQPHGPHPLTGIESHNETFFGCSGAPGLPAGPSTYETGAPVDHCSSQPAVHETRELVPEANLTPNLHQDQVPWHPVTSALPDEQALKQANDEDSVKNECLDHPSGDDRPGVLPVINLSKDLARTRKGRKKRGQFNECLRQETSNTRNMGACLRCRNQRVRCVPNKLDKESPLAPCETCLRVRRDTKKTIHNLPCLRFKVTSMATYRSGWLDLTKRFTHTKIVDVTEHADNDIFDVEMTQGLCRTPLRLRVRRFKPRATDVQNRKFVEDGIPKEQQIEPFCLVNAKKTATEFKAYIYNNALDGLSEAAKESDDMLKEIFAMITRHCTALSDPIKIEDEGSVMDSKNPDEKDFLLKMVHLWFAIRHGTNSAWLCGNELLGMTPDPGPNVPLPGRVSIPRMIVAQFDSIRHERIYKHLTPQVLRTFETFLTSSNKNVWFTVFLATFLLLHQAAITSQDRYRYAKQHSEGKPLETRYGAIGHPLTGFVEDIHHGAVILLAYWQYFKRCDLMSINWDDVRDPALRYLEPHQIQFMKRITGLLRARLNSIPTTPDEGCWEHELFWVSRMFVSEQSRKADWTPPETFSRAKPSVGKESV